MKKKAILLVENTDKLVVLAQFLVHDGWEIISSGTTAAFLKKSNIPVTLDKALTSNVRPESTFNDYLDKILNNKINSANELEEHPDVIDLVCINIRPTVCQLKEFTEVEKPDNCIDLKRISILRSAAKNFSNVTVLTDPADYEETISQLKVGDVVPEYRLYLAGKALNITSAYDASLSAAILFRGTQIDFPNYFLIPLERIGHLKHGMNSHQQGCIYTMNEQHCALSGVKKIQGREMNWANFQNCIAAWKSVSLFLKVIKNPYSVHSIDINGYPFTTQFTPQTGSVYVIAIKNNNPVSAAFGSNVTEAVWKAYNADQEGFEEATIGCSAVIDENAAREIMKMPVSMIVAPDYTKEAKEVFSANRELRLAIASKLISDFNEYVSIDGGLVVQKPDQIFFRQLQVVTATRPTQIQVDSMLFGMLIAMQAKSDAAVVVNDFTTVGICCGQTNRSRAIHYALENAKETFENNLTSSDRNAEILVSDSVIKFDENARMLADIGVKAIIQTGGAPNDQEFIDFCNEKGIAMIFTGIQHLAF